MRNTHSVCPEHDGEASSEDQSVSPGDETPSRKFDKQRARGLTTERTHHAGVIRIEEREWALMMANLVEHHE